MFFFCKPKKIVLDAFTPKRDIIDILRPSAAENYKPAWWYKVKSNVDSITGNGIVLKSNTIRRCQGFKDYYSDRSIIIPLWSSFVLEYGHDWSKSAFVNNSTSDIEFQQEHLRGGSYLKEFYHFKLASPWAIKEKSGVDFHFSQPFYNFKDPTSFIMPPAIVNYRYQHATNVNFFVKRPAEGEKVRLEMEAGQPLVYLTPLKKCEIEIRTHLVTYEEFNSIRVPVVFFNGLYSKAKKLGYGK